MPTITFRSVTYTANLLLITICGVLPSASLAQTTTPAFHFESICRSDPAANKDNVTVTLHGVDEKNAGGTTNYQSHAPLAGVTINVLWTYVDYRQNHAVFKYRQDSCITHSDGTCTFNGGSGRARWQLSEVVGYDLSSPAFDTSPTSSCPNIMMVDFW